MASKGRAIKMSNMPPKGSNQKAQKGEKLGGTVKNIQCNFDHTRGTNPGVSKKSR